MSKLGNRV